MHEIVCPARPRAVSSECFTDRDVESWDLWPICVLEVATDDGLTGLGEVGRGVHLKDIEAHLQRLIGMEVAWAGVEGNARRMAIPAVPGGVRSGTRGSRGRRRRPPAALAMCLIDLAWKPLVKRLLAIISI